MQARQGNPVLFAAKVLWVFSLFPAILAAVVFASDPAAFARSGRPLVLVWPVLVVALGYGVYKRSRAAVYAALAFFGLGCVAAAIGALLTHRFALIVWIGILAYPIRALWYARGALARG